MKNKLSVLFFSAWMCFVACGMPCAESTNCCITAYNAFVDLVNIKVQSDSLTFTKDMYAVVGSHRVSKAFQKILSFAYGDFRYLEGGLNIDGFDFSLLANRIAWVYYRFYGCCGIRERLPEFNSLYFRRLDHLILSEYSKMLKKKRKEEAFKRIGNMNIEEKLNLAQDQNATEEELDVLSQDVNFEIKVSVAKNKKTPFAVLEKYMKEERDSRITFEADKNLRCARTLVIDLKKDKDDYVNNNILRLLSATSEDELEMWCVSVKEMLKSGDHKTDARILEQINCVFDYYSSDIRKVPFKGSGRRFITLQEKIKLIREKVNPLF